MERLSFRPPPNHEGRVDPIATLHCENRRLAVVCLELWRTKARDHRCYNSTRR